jgi:hypothetical protein
MRQLLLLPLLLAALVLNLYAATELYVSTDANKHVVRPPDFWTTNAPAIRNAIDYGGIIYVDAIRGSDSTGTGTAAAPYATAEKADDVGTVGYTARLIGPSQYTLTRSLTNSLLNWKLDSGVILGSTNVFGIGPVFFITNDVVTVVGDYTSEIQCDSTAFWTGTNRAGAIVLQGIKVIPPVPIDSRGTNFNVLGNWFE